LNEKGNLDQYRILDIDKDGVPEVAIVTDDPDFGNHSHLYIYKNVNGKIEKLLFYNSPKEYFDELVVMHRFILIDDKDDIYCYSENVLNKQGNRQLIHIDKYAWNISAKKIMFVKSKLFNSTRGNIKTFIF
ncbi:MAG: hypothetical protein JSS96_17085, partial [Bacteroidetes bacterium]|nr:hypothetical protein [Bacteroidota bacterium]